MVQNLEGEIFVRGSGVNSKATCSLTDCNWAQPAAYLRDVPDVFQNWEIAWDLIEKRLVDVVFDVAIIMGAFVDVLHWATENRTSGIRDAARCLMRGIATAEGTCKQWFKLRRPIVPPITLAKKGVTCGLLIYFSMPFCRVALVSCFAMVPPWYCVCMTVGSH